MKDKIRGLQLIVNTNPVPAHPYLQLVLQAISGGVDTIQFRHKGMYTREIHSLVCQIAEVCLHFSIPLIVNDRVDIAIAIEATGVHLGQTDLPIKVARSLLGNKKMIGATASTIEQAKQAEIGGADYIGFGHIFPTDTKLKNHSPVGLMLLQQVCNQIRIPVLAIGGIKDHHIKDVCKTGVSGIAVVSAISASSDPFIQTRKFKEIMALYGI